MPYQLSRVVAGPFLHAFGRPRATGLENIPASGPALLASNHLSIVDSVYLPLMLSRPVVFPARPSTSPRRGPIGRAWAAYLRSTNQLAMNRDDNPVGDGHPGGGGRASAGGRPVSASTRRAPGHRTGGSTVAGRVLAGWSLTPAPRLSRSR